MGFSVGVPVTGVGGWYVVVVLGWVLVAVALGGALFVGWAGAFVARARAVLRPVGALALVGGLALVAFELVADEVLAGGELVAARLADVVGDADDVGVADGVGVAVGCCVVPVGVGDGLADAAGDCSGWHDALAATVAALAVAMPGATARITPEPTVSRTLPAINVTAEGPACANRMKRLPVLLVAISS